MRRPKVRDRAACPQEEKIRFTSAILPKWTRRSKSLDALLPMLHLRGISTGDFQEALAAIPGQDRFLPFFGNLFHFLGSVRPSVGSGLAWEDSFPSWRSPAGLLQGGNPSAGAASPQTRQLSWHRGRGRPPLKNPSTLRREKLTAIMTRKRKEFRSPGPCLKKAQGAQRPDSEIITGFSGASDAWPKPFSLHKNFGFYWNCSFLSIKLIVGGPTNSSSCKCPTPRTRRLASH